MDDLKNRSVSALIWGVGGTGLRVLIQVVSQIILARLLGPEQFGLFATGLVVIFFTGLFADAGLAYGLVQRAVVTDHNIRFIFTWQMVISILIAAVLYWQAPLIAAGFGDGRLAMVVRWLAATSIVTAAGSTSSALLRRNLDFRTLNIAAVLSYAIAFFAVGIPMALAGFNVLALVSAFVLQAFIASAIVYARLRHSVRPLFWDKDAPEIIGFGTTVFATNVVNWVMSSLDRAIVSASLGVTAAGLYSTMQNLVNVPAQSALSMLQPVFYSASSKVQGNLAQLRTGLRAMLSAIMLFVTPVFVAVALVAQTFVLALYGTKWAGGESVLAPLAIAIPAVLLMGLATPVLWTAGFPRREFQAQLPMSFLWAIVCLWAARSGSLPLVSWAVCGMFFLRAAVILRLTLAAVAMPVADLPRLFAPGLLVSAIVAVAAIGADELARSHTSGPQLQLGVIVAACAVAMMLGLRVTSTLFPPELTSLLASLMARVPAGGGRQVFGLVLGIPNTSR